MCFDSAWGTKLIGEAVEELIKLRDTNHNGVRTHSTARRGAARRGAAQHVAARHGAARHSTTRHGMARHGMTWHGMAWHGTARDGIQGGWVTEIGVGRVLGRTERRAAQATTLCLNTEFRTVYLHMFRHTFRHEHRGSNMFSMF